MKTMHANELKKSLGFLSSARCNGGGLPAKTQAILERHTGEVAAMKKAHAQIEAAHVGRLDDIDRSFERARQRVRGAEHEIAVVERNKREAEHTVEMSREAARTSVEARLKRFKEQHKDVFGDVHHKQHSHSHNHSRRGKALVVPVSVPSGSLDGSSQFDSLGRATAKRVAAAWRQQTTTPAIQRASKVSKAGHSHRRRPRSSSDRDVRWSIVQKHARSVAALMEAAPSCAGVERSVWSVSRSSGGGAMGATHVPATAQHQEHMQMRKDGESYSYSTMPSTSLVSSSSSMVGGGATVSLNPLLQRINNGDNYTYDHDHSDGDDEGAGGGGGEGGSGGVRHNAMMVAARSGRGGGWIRHEEQMEHATDMATVRRERDRIELEAAKKLADIQHGYDKELRRAHAVAEEGCKVTISASERNVAAAVEAIDRKQRETEETLTSKRQALEVSHAVGVSKALGFTPETFDKRSGVSLPPSMKPLSDKHNRELKELEDERSRVQTHAREQRAAVHQRHEEVVKEARGEMCETEVAEAQRKRVEAVEVARRDVADVAAAKVMYLEDQYAKALRASETWAASAPGGADKNLGILGSVMGSKGPFRPESYVYTFNVQRACKESERGGMGVCERGKVSVEPSLYCEEEQSPCFNKYNCIGSY